MIEFCVSCYSMQLVYQEYKQFVYFQNVFGVCVECYDCYIFFDISGMVKCKLEVSNDFYQIFIVYLIDILEKFEVKCVEFVECEWVCMKENNFVICCFCYNYDVMDYVKQNLEVVW